MPLPRTNAKEHPSGSHSQWGGSLKFVVQPVMAKHPDQPDKWTVSGVSRSYASKEDADKVRDFLKTNPPEDIKRTLSQGDHVDDLLPGHLQKLPHWDDVHGVDGVHGRHGIKGKKESVMSSRMMEMLHLLGECTEDCGCGKEEPKKEAIRFKQRDPGERKALAKGLRLMRRHAQSKWQGTDVVRGARQGMVNVVRAGGGTGARYEGAPVFSYLAVTEALEAAKEAMECGCFEKMDEAAEALLAAMCEAGCPPMQHMNRKLGKCARVPQDLHQQMSDAHQQSRKVRTPEEHGRAHDKMKDVASQLQNAGFHQLASLHQARAHAHKMASAN